MPVSMEGINYNKVNSGDFHEIRRESGDHYIEPMRGKDLKYDKGFSQDGDVTESRWNKQGAEATRAVEMGLPPVVYGKPLGCGCSEAYLHGVGEIVDGQIECDYMCSSGWHNYILFAMRTQGPESERGLKIDKFGNLSDGMGFEAKELEDF